VHARARAWGVVDLPDVGFVSEKKRPHVIHLGMLDAVFHLAFADIKGAELSVVMVPRFIEELFVSADILYVMHAQLKGLSTTEKHGFKELWADISMQDEKEIRPILSTKGLTCTEVAGVTLPDSGLVLRNLCSWLVRSLAVDILTTEYIKGYSGRCRTR
jgi:hypothetical protein